MPRQLQEKIYVKIFLVIFAIRDPNAGSTIFCELIIEIIIIINVIKKKADKILNCDKTD